MHIRTVVVESHDEMGRLIAGRMAELIRERTATGKTAVLGLASGSTPIPVYRELIRMHREDGLSFANVVTFNLDEYFGISPDSIHSYARYMWENFFGFVDIKPENVHIPRGDIPREMVAQETHRYEEMIREAGGIDIQILGIGKTGHIGFNEPGSGMDSRTRLVTLDMVTRKDAAADFFGEDNVPREAISMGVGTIMEAREILILATGEHKADVVRRAVEGEIDLEVPATFLQKHSNTTFYLDRAAAADLTPIATPWLVDEVEWTEELAIRAVTWLARRCGRGILKLTQRDYAENRLSSLVALHGSPGALNGMVFNALGAKIRGRSKLPRGKRIICFSPHPDDDVISMGGILRKLIENENDIVVAYMTSGNIAVFDHDVRRHIDFLERMAADGYVSAERIDALSSKVLDSLARKRPGEVDIPEVLDIKRKIRETEAVSGIEVLGLSRGAAHFLNLPFYRTGKVRKDPVGPADVAIVRQLIEEHQPDLVFVAGDLSDPHGTHRMCKEAIDSALCDLYGEKDCENVEGAAREELAPTQSVGAENRIQTSGRREELAPTQSVGAENRIQTSGRREELAPTQSVGADNRTQTSGRRRRPEVWLYRGAWQEWPVTEASWLVPLSQEELRLKIQAIFKHQSQKDTAPFPGQDDREFWQRVEARNKGTAAELDALGLAEYFAMEAYVVE